MPKGTPGRSVCTIDGCSGLHYARGWCEMHYARWRRTRRTAAPSAAERFWAKVDKDGPECRARPDMGPCWLWTGALDTANYGNFGAGGRGGTVKAYRFAYELLVGPVPDGLHLDHVCHSVDLRCPGGPRCMHRRCVNPAHMEPVTPLENHARGIGNQYVRRTHCSRGHEFTPENTGRRRDTGTRICRTCTNDRAKAKRSADRAERTR